MSPALIAFFTLAVALRLASLVVSKRNEKRLRAAGAQEHGAGNTRVIALLHTTFYLAAFAEGWWRGASVGAWTWAALALYALAMLTLLHVVRALGGLWSVKVLLAPHHTLNRGWLFRHVRHPNYFLNIIPELVGVGLVLKAWLVLLVVLPCYLVALAGRIRIEEAAMRERFPEYA